MNKTTMNIDASVLTIVNISEAAHKSMTIPARVRVIRPIKESLSKQFAAKIKIKIDSINFIDDTSDHCVVTKPPSFIVYP